MQGGCGARLVRRRVSSSHLVSSKLGAGGALLAVSVEHAEEVLSGHAAEGGEGAQRVLVVLREARRTPLGSPAGWRRPTAACTPGRAIAEPAPPEKYGCAPADSRTASRSADRTGSDRCWPCASRPQAPWTAAKERLPCSCCYSLIPQAPSPALRRALRPHWTRNPYPSATGAQRLPAKFETDRDKRRLVANSLTRSLLYHHRGAPRKAHIDAPHMLVSALSAAYRRHDAYTA